MSHSFPAHNLRSQAARDLVWALESPSLMDHPKAVDSRWGRFEIARNQGLISRLDKPDSALRRAMRERQGGRLGEYFERLLITWFEHVPPATLLGANEQVYRGQDTVGEFDLLFRRDGLDHHWELAIKFYLGHRGAGGRPNWYGPNSKDRLDKKWSKMLGRQLRLGRKPAARQRLSKLGVDEHVEPKAFIKGYLFEPLDETYAVDLHPDANRRAPRGWWVHRGELANVRGLVDPDDELRWMRLSRLRWMSPTYVDERDELHDFDLLERSLYSNRPSLVAGLAETDDGPREVTRGFVVPDRWPYRSPGQDVPMHRTT